MRRLAELPPDRAAKLAAALCARGLPAVAQAGEGGGEVWVREEDHLPAARAELAAFLADPDAPRFADAETRAAAVAEQTAERAKVRRGRTVRGREVFDAPVWKRAPVSCGLIAACCAVALCGWDPSRAPLSFWERTEPVLKWLYVAPVEAFEGSLAWRPGLGLGPTFAGGQLWRVFTPALLHANPVHLLFNMSWLWGLGAMLEARFGSGRYAAGVLLVAALSNLAEYYVDMQLYLPILGLFAVAPGPFFGGMSGVAVGLFGFAWGRMKGGDPGVRLDPNGVVFMVGVLLACVVGVFPIANAAHFAGLGIGFAGGWFTAKREYRVRPR